MRIEIESALAQKKRVIPVLVNDARMPRSTELPEGPKPFARCNAVWLTHERFRAIHRPSSKRLSKRWHRPRQRGARTARRQLVRRRRDRRQRQSVSGRTGASNLASAR